MRPLEALGACCEEDGNNTIGDRIMRKAIASDALLSVEVPRTRLDQDVAPLAKYPPIADT